MKDINIKSNSDNVSSELNILKFKWSFYSERCWSSEPKMRSNKNNGETEKKNMIMRLSIIKYSLLFGGKWHQNGDLFMEVVWKISLWILADGMRCCRQFWKLYSVWFEQFEQIFRSKAIYLLHLSVYSWCRVIWEHANKLCVHCWFFKGTCISTSFC